MADLKISQLNSLAGASLANNDVVAVVDTSASETKKITSVDLIQYGYGLLSAGTLDGDIIEAGTTSARGTIQLTDSTSSTSTTTAATPNSVKSAYDLGNAALPKTGGTMTGAILADDSASPSTPGYAFDGDPDTGLLRTGANQLAVVTGGSARITVDASGNVVIPGNFTVQGTTTTIDTTTLVVKDKNIEMGAVATPSDVTADGGGITLRGSTDKTINWIDATDAWTFSEHVNIASAKEYRIAGTKVLDATSLGSAVVSSSLTSVGTIATGIWNGTTIGTAYGGTGQTTYTDGELLIGNSTGNTLSKSTLTAGSGITIANGSGAITISATGGGTVTSVTGTAPISVATGTTTPAISIAAASTSAIGAVQLTDSTSSTSTTTAATPNAVKSAYDLANAALPTSGGTMTGAITFAAGQTISGYGPLDGASTWTKGQRGEVTALTSASTVTIDMADSNNFSLTLAHNVTLANPTNLTAGQSGAIVITQSSGGSNTVSYGIYFKFPGGTVPSKTLTANSVCVLLYYVESATRITAQLLNDVKV